MAKKPRYRGHPLAYIISGGLFVIVAIGAILLTRGYTIDIHTGELRKTGLAVLGSYPDKAYITIDGDVKDVRTRSRLTLIPGTYNITVDLPDTHPWEKRLNINPGEAVLEEDILLFLEKPISTPLTDGPVAGFSLDASSHRVAYLQPTEGGVGLFVRNTDGKDKTRQITLLPPNYATPTSLNWSSDGNRIAASVAGESRIVTVNDGTTATVAVGGRTTPAPGQSDVLLVEQTPGTIVRVQSSGTVEPVETDVAAWTVTSDAAYLSKSDGATFRISGTDKKPLENGSVQAELLAAPGTDRVFGRTADGTVTLFTNGSPERITAGAERFIPARGGEQAVYIRQRELRLWNGKENTDDLLTRFTDVPSQLAVMPGGNYALFGSGTSIGTIAADGSNSTELTTTDSLLNVLGLETLLVRDSAGRLVNLEVLTR